MIKVLLMLLISCAIVYVLGLLFELDRAFKFRLVLKNFDKISYSHRGNCDELYFFLRLEEIELAKIKLHNRDIVIFDLVATGEPLEDILLEPRFHIFLCRRLRKKLLSLVPKEDIPDTRKRDFTDYL